MKEKRIIIILIIALVFGIIGCRKKYSEEKISKELVGNLSWKEEELGKMVLIHSRFAHPFSFSNTFELINEENKEIKIGSIIGDKNILIYKISQNNCSSCAESELYPLDTLYSRNPQQNQVILLAENYNYRKLKVLKNINKFKYPVYIIKYPDFFRFLAVEKLNLPYFFVLDSTLEAKMIFIPNKLLPDVSKRYYEQILNIFKEKNK
jgi:hypothetical protein